ncbi:hypothetical protein [Occallatibacter savannae]|uniref:hypothetical protein n=1 Tax=Occallatibacter savannae TaxID=1002691 RepID=UPI0013A54117|nr:hypothetical protein [Occallatibacter savannae]
MSRSQFRIVLFEPHHSTQNGERETRYFLSGSLPPRAGVDQSGGSVPLLLREQEVAEPKMSSVQRIIRREQETVWAWDLH